MKNLNEEIVAVLGSSQAHAAISDGKIVPTLTSAMGMGGGQIPLIIMRMSEHSHECKKIGIYKVDNG